MDLLEQLLNISKFDVLVFTEHWATIDTLPLIRIPNFQLVSNFSRLNHIHGGSAIYVKNNISSKNRDDISNRNKELDFEISAIEVDCARTIYCCIYRSPGGNIDVFSEQMMALLEILFTDGQKCVILGDFNIDALKPTIHYKNLTDMCASYITI
jgi:exonuclease III